MDVDPTASMRVWAVEVDIGAVVARIPPLPASDWLPTLMEGDVFGVFGLVEGLDIEELLVDGEITINDAVGAAVKLIESAAGRSVWMSLALASLAKVRWLSIGSDIVRSSVRLDQVSLGAALDAIYGAITQGMDEKGVARLNATLFRPPAEFQLALGLEPFVDRFAREPKPLPASAEQYVRVRPKTVLRRPQDRQGAENVQPTVRPEERAGNGRVGGGVSSRGGVVRRRGSPASGK